MDDLQHTKSKSILPVRVCGSRSAMSESNQRRCNISLPQVRRDPGVLEQLRFLPTLSKSESGCSARWKAREPSLHSPSSNTCRLRAMDSVAVRCWSATTNMRDLGCILTYKSNCACILGFLRSLRTFASKFCTSSVDQPRSWVNSLSENASNPASICTKFQDPTVF